MRQSYLFTKTRKEAPKDEVSKNAELLIRGGFINKELAGVYDFLPLGLIVLRKIENIVREEMNKIGGQEVLLTVLQDEELWKETQRWDIDVWFKTKLKSGTELGLGFSHEEPLTRLLKDHIRSYKDLPKAIYQIQTKFRNETRAKSGIMRGREFQMKDMYSFSRDDKEHEEFYERAKIAYMNVFERLGLGTTTFMTFASGGVFSKYSHEFQTLTSAGEDIIYVDEKKKLAVNKEVYTDEVLKNLKLNKKDLKEEKAIEVGNIFSLGTRFSDALGLEYINEKGKEQAVIMGCYGMGTSRLMGTVVEVLSDEKGIVWPESIAPFQIHLIEIAGKSEKVAIESEKTLKEFEQQGF